MKTQVQHTPGALAAARCIVTQIERLDPTRTLDDRQDSIEGIASIIDTHTAAPDLLAACEKVLDSLGNMTTEDFRRGADKEARELLATVVAKARGD